jgi:hypothetical protein
VTTSLTPRRVNNDLRSDILVVVVAVVALLIGFLYENSLTAQTTTFTDSHSGLTLSIPNNWTVNSVDDTEVFVSAYDTRADSVFKSSITGRSFALDTEKPADLDTIANGLVAERQDALLGFHLLSIETITIGGSEGRAVHYAYVAQPIDEAFSDSPPVVVLVTDYVAYSPGKEYWVLSTAADEKIAEREQKDFDVILKSIKLPQ